MNFYFIASALILIVTGLLHSFLGERLVLGPLSPDSGRPLFLCVSGGDTPQPGAGLPRLRDDLRSHHSRPSFLVVPLSGGGSDRLAGCRVGCGRAPSR
jgi:hypothetical protein